MRNILSILFVIGIIGFFSIGGCGGGGDSCTFNLNAVKNGPNFDEATSEWICDTLLEFALYQDGTGSEPLDIGFFTYQRTGCRTLEFQADEGGDGVFDNLGGSRDSGILIFDQISEDFGTFSVNCTLNEFEEEPF